MTVSAEQNEYAEASARKTRKHPSPTPPEAFYIVREAADAIRTAAERTFEREDVLGELVTDWYGPEAFHHDVATEITEEEAQFISDMSPEFALAVAEMLQVIAETMHPYRAGYDEAVAVSLRFLGREL